MTPSDASLPLDAASLPPATSKRDFAALAKQYAQDVVRGRVPACRQVKQACQRHLTDLARIRKREFGFDFIFDKESASRACEFIEALPHIKGAWARRKELITLTPSWAFIIASLFGWVERARPDRYRFRIAYICVPRKAAKTTICAGIELYKFCADGEYAAEVYIGATSLDQAKRTAFKTCRAMVMKSPSLKKHFGIKVNVHSLVRDEDGSILKPVIAKPGDGDSPSCAALEEFHEHGTYELLNAMYQGMAARDNPLLLEITTAGNDISSPCYETQQQVEKILDGSVVDERIFGIVYTIDPEDDWTTEAALVKAQPSLGITVDRQKLLDDQASAVAFVEKQNDFKNKQLNVWTNTRNAWLNSELWKACANPELLIKQFEGQPCVIGLDLADEIDIASKVYVFGHEVNGESGYAVFTKHYLNSARVREKRNAHYLPWVADGWLTETRGNVTDYPLIKEDLIDDCERYLVKEVAFDPHHAPPLVQFVQQDPRWDQSIEFVKITQSAENLSPAMHQIEKNVRANSVEHDGDPVMSWMMSNVVARAVGKDSIIPDRANADSKIDGAAAYIMAMSRAGTLPESNDGPGIDELGPSEEETPHAVPGAPALPALSKAEKARRAYFKQVMDSE
jgi:phage terminase large subunit-like protein